jgi:hypothetical protein
MFIVISIKKILPPSFEKIINELVTTNKEQRQRSFTKTGNNSLNRDNT